MESNKWDIGLIAACCLASIGILAVFIPFTEFNGIQIGIYSINIDQYDKLGSFIGGITTPFLSLSAFIMLYLTYKSQKEELFASRVELQESKKILIEQNATQTIQRFDNTFFSSLQLLNHIIENISYTVYHNENSGFVMISDKQFDTPRIYRGRESFSYFYDELREFYKRDTSNSLSQILGDEVSTAVDENNLSNKELVKTINKSYESMFKKHQSSLGHYFRTIYNIIKLIDEREPKDQAYYANMVKAQLSTYEHLLLFYNCISPYGNILFKPLVIKYSLLNGLSEDALLETLHKELYPLDAF